MTTTARNPATTKLIDTLGPDRVVVGDEALRRFAEDPTECAPRLPAVAVFPTSVGDVQQILRIANETKTAVTVRVTAMNIGGLAIPHAGGIVVDLSRMDQIVSVDEEDMVAVVEPGVSWAALKSRLDASAQSVVVSYPLAPPETSVAACCLLDGTGTLTMRYGSMGDWIGGIEAVLANGEVVRTGAAAVTQHWYGRAALPDLAGLFLNWQGTTGIVTKLAVQLWPKRRLRTRVFIPVHELLGGIALMRLLARTGLFDDLGGLTWPAGRMLLGIDKPRARDKGEPEILFYLDISADLEFEVMMKRAVLAEAIREVRSKGHHIDDPIPLDAITDVNPEFKPLAEFPARLGFLIDNPGGGLTWVGTYGPMSRLPEGAKHGLEIMEKHGFPPLIVTRPMKGGHYCVLRFVITFAKRNAAEVERVRACNRELIQVALDHGFMTYKLPPWAAPELAARIHPGTRALIARVRQMMDPNRILAPDNLRFD
ncbi:MAG: FAD-binding oxidoreductase [Deltaproteobacteria bacterium]|nr:FAD-binding oxidoreductase [Deltaproteobacteria bacterium]